MIREIILISMDCKISTSYHFLRSIVKNLLVPSSGWMIRGMDPQIFSNFSTSERYTRGLLTTSRVRSLDGRYWLHIGVLAINLRVRDRTFIAGVRLKGRETRTRERRDAPTFDRWPNERTRAINKTRHCFYSVTLPLHSLHLINR